MRTTISKLVLTISVLTMGGSSVGAGESEATKLLETRSEQLMPTVTRVSDSVYCASGYSPPNISMIVGTSGIVIVDAGMFRQDAETVLSEFRKITDLPVAAIILTHGHGDHTGGTAAFIAAGAINRQRYTLAPRSIPRGPPSSGLD